MDFELIRLIAVGVPSVVALAGFWIGNSAHISSVEWLNDDRTRARITVYLWYAPWRQKTATIGKKSSDLFTWYFLDEYGDLTAHDVSSEICGYLSSLKTKQERKFRELAEKAKAKEQKKFWTNGKPQLPPARVVNEDH